MQGRNPLWDAINAVAKGADPNTPDANGDPLIFKVIDTGNTDMLNALLATNEVKFDVTNSGGKTPAQYCMIKAGEVGDVKKNDAKLMEKMEQGEQIDQADYQRLKNEMKKEAGSDNKRLDEIFRDMNKAILVKAGKIAEPKPTKSAPSSPFVERKDVSKEAQDLVSDMRYINTWSAAAEKSYLKSLYENDKGKKSELISQATKEAILFLNRLDEYNDKRDKFNKNISDKKNKTTKAADIAYLQSAKIEYLNEALPRKNLENPEKLNIDPVKRREKVQDEKQKKDDLIAETKSKSDPGPQTRARSNSLGVDTRGATTRSRSASVVGSSQGNSTGNMFKNMFKGASPAAIRKDRAASAEASPKTEKATAPSPSSAASPEVARTPTTSPASDTQEQEQRRTPGMGRRN